MSRAGDGFLGLMLLVGVGVVIGLAVASLTRGMPDCRGALHAVGVGEAGHEFVALVVAGDPLAARWRASDSSTVLVQVEAQDWHSMTRQAVGLGEAARFCQKEAPR